MGKAECGDELLARLLAPINWRAAWRWMPKGPLGRDEIVEEVRVKLFLKGELRRMAKRWDYLLEACPGPFRPLTLADLNRLILHEEAR